MNYDCVAAFGCSFVEGAAISGGKDLRHTDKETKWVGEKHRFSKILAEHFSIPEINMAHSGFSNESILRRVYRFFKDSKEQYKNPLVIVGTSGFTRKEVFSNFNQQSYDLHPLSPYFYDKKQYSKLKDVAKKFTGNENNTDELKNFVEFQMKYFFNEDFEIEKLNWQISFLIGFLKSKNIAYVLFNSIDDYLTDDLKESSNYISFGKFNHNKDIIVNKSESTYGANKDSWYNDINYKHITEYGSWENGSRSQFEPYGKYSCGGHPSPGSHKNLANKILNYINENNI